MLITLLVALGSASRFLPLSSVHPLRADCTVEEAEWTHPAGEEPEEATFHAGRMRLLEAAARALVSLTIHPQRMMLRERPIARLGPMSTSTPDVNRQELSRA